MARPTLDPAEVERFRQRLCEVALRRFSEDGYEAVTLRALARELGCSYATPYRYFRDKQEIFAAVRALAYERFAAALEASVIDSTDPEERLRRLVDAYVRFAVEQPQAYRIMFELDQPELPGEPARGPKELRAWEVWHAEVRAAVEAGVLVGDPALLAHLLWAGVHGVVALHLAGKLVLGESLEALAPPMLDALLTAHRAPRSATSARSR